MSHRANILRAYRELIDLLKRLPPSRREAGLQEARAAVRANASERDALKASDMLKDLVARISFLRMATPKHARDRCPAHQQHHVHGGECHCLIAVRLSCWVASTITVLFCAPSRRSNHGAVTYVLRDGELVEGQGRTEGRSVFCFNRVYMQCNAVWVHANTGHPLPVAAQQHPRCCKMPSVLFSKGGMRNVLACHAFARCIAEQHLGVLLLLYSKVGFWGFKQLPHHHMVCIVVFLPEVFKLKFRFIACRVADGSMSVDEAYSRHKQLLKRQHFGKVPPNVKKFF